MFLCKTKCKIDSSFLNTFLNTIFRSRSKSVTKKPPMWFTTAVEVVSIQCYQLNQRNSSPVHKKMLIFIQKNTLHTNLFQQKLATLPSSMSPLFSIVKRNGFQLLPIAFIVLSLLVIDRTILLILSITLCYTRIPAYFT